MIETGKIFSRASAARNDDDLDRAAAARILMPNFLMKVSQPRHHLPGRRVSLHLHWINEHVRGVMPSRENVKDVPQRRPLRRGDDADFLWQWRDRVLYPKFVQCFPPQSRLLLPLTHLHWACPPRLPAFNRRFQVLPVF